MYRGTLRNIGHCESWNYFKKMGLLNQEKVYDLTKMTPGSIVADLVKSDGKNVVSDISRMLQILHPYHIDVVVLKSYGCVLELLLMYQGMLPVE